MKNDHLKAAPCVSANFLTCLRITISIALVAQTIFTILETSKNNVGLRFISMWNLFFITILFTTMAIVQVQHSRRLTKFKMELSSVTIDENVHESDRLDLGQEDMIEG